MLSHFNAFHLLKTKEDAKLSQILNRQRYHQHQLLNEHQNVSIDSVRTTPERRKSDEEREGSELLTRPLKTYPVANSSICDIRLSGSGPFKAWTSGEGVLRGETSQAVGIHPNQTDITLLDVSEEDFDARSSVSLLESESLYLPIDGTKTPTRSMTAPAITTPATASFIASLSSSDNRPETVIGDVRETKYEAYERKMIKPLNQDILKGVLKPSFEFSPPQTCGTGPSVRVRKHTPPTAESHDYDTSIDNNQSDHENIDMEKAPSQNLSLIRDVVGVRKAQKVLPMSVEDRKVKLFQKVEKSDKTELVKSGIPVLTSAPYRSEFMSQKYRNKRGGEDSKSVKSRLNMEKCEEFGKPGNMCNNSVRDSGFISRPSSDAVLGDATVEEQKAAIAIQSFWRGYRAREHDPEVISVRKEIRARRAEDHIVLLKAELERQQHQYSEERKLRTLQMEAIKTLWQEVQSLQNWKNEVLSSQCFLSSQDSNKHHTAPVFASLQSSSSYEKSDTLERLSNSTVKSAFNTVDSERQRDLEKTCASLQSQVSQLQEALDSISSAVSHSNCFTLSRPDNSEKSGGLHVTGNFDDDFDCSGYDGSPNSGRWSVVPHSLSPYPSEEEENYFKQVPQYGVPTPPRGLKLDHRGENSVILRWWRSTLLDDMGRDMQKSIIGYRVYVNDECRALVPNNRTTALAAGLNSNTTYKFYIKALSGLGESYESNIIMAKLAKGVDHPRLSISSDSDLPDDSDKDHDSTENQDRRQHRRRETRKPRKVKSPRSDKKRSKTVKEEQDIDTRSVHSPVQERLRTSKSDHSVSAILTQPKLHTHRRNGSGEFRNQVPETTTTDGSGSSKDKIDVSGLNVDADNQKTYVLSSHSSVSSSPTKSRYSESSANVSSKPFPQSGVSDSKSSTSMSETFTVDQASSYLQSITARVVKETIANTTKTKESQDKVEFVKTHRRKRSKDLKGEAKTYSNNTSETGEQSAGADALLGRDSDSTGSHKSGDGKDPGRKTSDGSIEDGQRDENVHGHRRKRSKDLQIQVVDWRREDTEQYKGESKAPYVDNDSMGLNKPVIDGRKRHSSGSRPSSPMLLEQPERDTPGSTIERRRTPVAETLEQRLLNISKSNSSGSGRVTGTSSAQGQRSRQLPDPNLVQDESIRKRTQFVGSEGDLPSAVSQSAKQDHKSHSSKLTQKLQTLSKSQEKVLQEKRRKYFGAEKTTDRPASDDERTRSRVRNLSESDCDQSSDTSGMPPRAPVASDSSSGSHSDDSRSVRSHRTHRRTPSGGSLVPPFSPTLIADRPTYSPIIMEGAAFKKSSTTVRRHASFHGILPSKHQDTKHGTTGTEENLAPRVDDQAGQIVESLSKQRRRLRSRSPSPSPSVHQPVISAVQLQKQ